MSAFLPGLQLSEQFYREEVGPILGREFPGLPHSAALLGTGSEVLGFDTTRSTDHGWGPRLQLFLAERDNDDAAAAIAQAMRRLLPREFAGYPTNFAQVEGDGSLVLRPTSGPVNHRVEVTTVPRFVERQLGITTYPDVSVVDWLLCPEQRLLEVTAGAVYHDGLGAVEPLRAAFHYYPHDIWLHRLAAQWTRLGQIEPFVGRCGEVGDDLGSALVAASLVHDLMRLGFLMERRYAPYSKWFGSAFARLTCAPKLRPALQGALRAIEWHGREHYLCMAYMLVVEMHNDLGLTDPLPTTVHPFYDRPFNVIDGERLAHAIRERITDERVRRLPPEIGGVDQFADSTDVLTDPTLLMKLRALYE